MRGDLLITLFFRYVYICIVWSLVLTDIRLVHAMNHIPVFQVHSIPSIQRFIIYFFLDFVTVTYYDQENAQGTCTCS